MLKTMSLKQELHKQLQATGYLTLDQVYEIANRLGYKQKTAERVLNPSISPQVKTIHNEKNHITGYVWKPQVYSFKSEEIIQTPLFTNTPQQLT